jgi:phosphoserine phosphatase
MKKNIFLDLDNTLISAELLEDIQDPALAFAKFVAYFKNERTIGLKLKMTDKNLKT